MYRIQFRNIGRLSPVELQGEADAAEALYMLLSSDIRVVSCAVWQPGEKSPALSFDRSRPVIRERDSVRIVKGG